MWAAFLTALNCDTFFSPHIIFSYYWLQCGTDTPLQNSCRYLMISQGSAFIHNRHLSYWWYVPSSISSYPYRLSWYTEYSGKYGSWECHMQIPWGLVSLTTPTPYLIHKYDHWVSYPDSFHIYGCNAVIFCQLYIICFLAVVFLVAATQAWWFLPLSGGERGSRCVFLKYSWVIFGDDILKCSHV